MLGFLFFEIMIAQTSKDRDAKPFSLVCVLIYVNSFGSFVHLFVYLHAIVLAAFVMPRIAPHRILR